MTAYGPETLEIMQARDNRSNGLLMCGAAVLGTDAAALGAKF
jgi:hypothetical protein